MKAMSVCRKSSVCLIIFVQDCSIFCLMLPGRLLLYKKHVIVQLTSYDVDHYYQYVIISVSMHWLISVKKYSLCLV